MPNRALFKQDDEKAKKLQSLCDSWQLKPANFPYHCFRRL
jgi:hypothetical protein